MKPINTSFVSIKSLLDPIFFGARLEISPRPNFFEAKLQNVILALSSYKKCLDKLTL